MADFGPSCPDWAGPNGMPLIFCGGHTPPGRGSESCCPSSRCGAHRTGAGKLHRSDRSHFVEDSVRRPLVVAVAHRFRRKTCRQARTVRASSSFTCAPSSAGRDQRTCVMGSQHKTLKHAVYFTQLTSRGYPALMLFTPRCLPY